MNVSKGPAFLWRPQIQKIEYGFNDTIWMKNQEIVPIIHTWLWILFSISWNSTWASNKPVKAKRNAVIFIPQKPNPTFSVNNSHQTEKNLTFQEKVKRFELLH